MFIPYQTVIEAQWLNSVQDHLESPHAPFDYLCKGAYRLYEDFGTENDHTPWVRAMNSLQPGEILLVRPDGQWYIDEPLIFLQGNISIINPFGRRDYACILQPGQANIPLLTFGSSGGVVKGINFWGLTSEINTAHTPGGSYGTCDGLIASRSGSGADPAYANLDMRIEDCGFSGLRDNIIFYGRNLTIRDCSMDEARFHIRGRVFTYGTGNTKTQTRGIKIHDNVFHNAGFRKNELLDTTTACGVIDITVDDTIIEGDRCVNSVEVYDNYTYRSQTFYNGPISGCRISNNECYIATGPLASINVDGSSYIGADIPGMINSNIWWGNADQGAETLYNARNGIIANKVHNLKLANNYLFNCSEALVKITDVYNLHMVGDTLAYANMSYQRPGSIDSSAIEIKPQFDTTYGHVQLDSVDVQGGPSGTGLHTYALNVLANGDKVDVAGGHFTPGRLGVINGK